MKYYLKTSAPFILLLILLMLTSCTQTEEKEKEQNTDDSDMIYTFENPQTQQKFKIVHATPLVKQYIEKVKENPKNSNLVLYKEEIIQPVYKDCFENGEFIYMAKNLLHSVPENFTELESISQKIEDRKIIINALIQEALLKSAELLPSHKDVAVCVFPTTDFNAPFVTVGAGKIIIPYNKYVDDDYIKVGVAHEYHHSFWAEKYLGNNSLSVLDNLIFEGKAVMFEKTVFPYLDYSPVDLTFNKELWSKIEPDLNKKDLNRSREILFGGNDLPLLYGYNEGYKMIKSYLDLHPNQTPEDWTALSSQEIIEKGKYFDKYK
ncbi:DUF2268 domain-containing protein [Solibacillus sp. MA9]|uniref:DUF2268 domain-containing protein n=1 Tax=Solibacillus palustris TaxID=2908203 RepID=A0ABS9UGU1_9BACL|nr:DUF2268 domain-containing putative Zn-dependent protease [Solibacillus sp. MA9]MCH7323355.1 DUF2268 domain-containing protein [Solibacillus sp. MA9]